MNNYVLFWEKGVPYEIHKWTRCDESPYLFIPVEMDDIPTRYQGEIVYGVLVPNSGDTNGLNAHVIKYLQLMFKHDRSQFHSDIKKLYRDLNFTGVLVTNQGFRMRHSVVCSGVGAHKSEVVYNNNREVYLAFTRVLAKKQKDEPTLDYISSIRSVLDTHLFGEFYYTNVPKWFTEQKEYWDKFDINPNEHHPDTDMH